MLYDAREDPTLRKVSQPTSDLRRRFLWKGMSEDPETPCTL